MIPLIIILSVLTILIFLPLSADLKFDGDFSFKLKIGGISVFKNDAESEKEDTQKSEKVKKSEKNPDKKSMFSALSEKKGFSGAVSEIFALVKAVLEKIKRYIKHVAVRRLCLDITVATPDAAQTAIEYGAVCSTAYPLLAFIDGIANVKIKQINILSDFNSDKPKIAFSVIIKARLIFLILMAIGAISEFIKFKTRNEL